MKYTSFPLTGKTCRVEHIASLFLKARGDPEAARHLTTDLPEKLSRLTKQEKDVEKLTEVLLGS